MPRWVSLPLQKQREGATEYVSRSGVARLNGDEKRHNARGNDDATGPCAQVKNKEEPAEGTASETQPMLGR